MPRKRVVQNHHIFYETKTPKGGVRQREVIVPVFQGEHYILSQIQRLKPENCSKGFVAGLEVLIATIRFFAKDIE
jgi:hypothetical protein